MNLADAVVYDEEIFPNIFTLYVEALNSDASALFEISEWKDDRHRLISWMNSLSANRTPMIGFYSEQFDYPLLHFIYMNPTCTIEDIYNKAQNIITGDRFANVIWDRDRVVPQIDLFKIHHFDNKAKSTSLKYLECNMRSERVIDMPVSVGQRLTRDQVDNLLIPYNMHDVKETKKFAHYSRKAMSFRAGLVDRFGPEVMNYNDTKIGAKLLEKRIGDDLCYIPAYRDNDGEYHRKQTRQTYRSRIALSEIIFPYIYFQNPEFARVLDWMKAQVLTPEDLQDEDAASTKIQTKGVFKDISATVGGITFHFGTGGVHGSIDRQRLFATSEWFLRDIDVTSLYPSIGIVNRLFPAHLGEIFITEYAALKAERLTHAKGTVENASLKLALNGTYGNSNNIFSPFYDPQYTMSITINGQLLLCMLAEWLLSVPTIQLIQINTDGITYRIHKDYEPQAAEICKKWQAYTLLELEDANYKAMWIRDVNNYIAQDTKGKLKLKGAYWYPRPQSYADDISEASPPAWHKDLGGLVIVKAAVAAMVHGVDPEQFVRMHSDPFDFMLRTKIDRSSKLMLGNDVMQRTTRYYVANVGADLRKISPPTAGNNVGDFKRKAKVPDSVYQSVLRSIPPGTWDERIHTKNKSRHEDRVSQIVAGRKCAECNDVANFNFANVDYSYYIEEARKLII